MKRVSVLLPPISRRGRERERGSSLGRTEEEEEERDLFYLFATSSHIFGEVPSSPITIAMSPKRRGVFSSPHFILLRDSGGHKKMTAISQTGFLLRIPQEKHLPASFFAIVREKGLKPGMERERGRRDQRCQCRATRIEALGLSRSGACLTSLHLRVSFAVSAH